MTHPRLRFAGLALVLLSAIQCGDAVAPLVPTRIAIDSGDAQIAVVGTTVKTPLSVTITDAEGKRVPGYPIAFAVTSGGGALNDTVVLSNASGTAVVSGWTLGTAVGANRVNVTSPGLAARAEFRATGVADVPVRLVAKQSPAAAASGVDFNPQPVLTLVDQYGNLALTASAPVTVSVVSGNNALTGTKTIAADKGTIAFTNLRLSGAPGSVVLEFATPGIPSWITPQFPVAPGPLAQLQPINGGQTALVGTSVGTPPGFRAVDAQGNPIAGVLVTMSPSAGTLGGFPKIVTGADGIAVTSAWVLPSTVGTFTLTGSATGVSNATLNATTIPDQAVGIVASAGANQVGQVGLALPVAPTFKVVDKFGNAVAGVSVAFSVSGGSVATPAPQTSNSSGIVGVGTWTLGPVGGIQSITATAGALTTTIAAQALVPAQLILATPPARAATGVLMQSQPVVRVRDSSGLAIGGGAFTITVAVTSGPGVLTGLTSIVATSGTATFTNLVLTGVGTTTLTFTSPGLTPASAAVTVTDGSATTIFANTLTGTAVVGGVMTATAHTTDEWGAHAPNTPVLFEVIEGGGSINAGTVTTNGTGLAPVTWTLGPAIGLNRLIAYLPGRRPAGAIFSATTTIPTLPATHLTIVRPPAGSVSTLVLATQPVVELRDALERVVNSSANVSVGITSGGATLAGTTTIALINGVGTYANLKITGTGTQQLTFTSGAFSSAASVTVQPLLASSASVTSGNGQTAAAGTAVGAPPTVRVVDVNGNGVPGWGVTFSVASGGGSLSAPAATTDGSGVATPGTWTLGSTPGANSLLATVGSVGSPLTITATAVVGPAAKLAIVAAPAGAIDGSPLGSQPIVHVQDAVGNHVTSSTAPITAAVATGSTTIGGTTSVTASAGVATFTDLTLAGTGPASLTFTSPGLATATTSSFTVASAVGAPARIVIVAGGVQTAEVGTSTPLAPAVRVIDANGRGVPGVALAFSVSLGGGTISGAPTTTNAQGVAQLSDWTLGTTVGPNLLAVGSGSVPASPVAFAASATPGAPLLTLASGNGQTSIRGGSLVSQPTVRVADRYGNLVSGATVNFAVTTGGGSLTGPTVTTTATGLASPTEWTLGSVVGANTLLATLPSNNASPSITFTATAQQTAYPITVRYLTAVSPAQQAAFTAAVDRWQSIIAGPVTAAQVVRAEGYCFDQQPDINEVVTGLLIYAIVGPIDGEGAILGQAGPCVVTAGTFMPVYGVMEFDEADLASLEHDGQLNTVILHEMGHVLGFGSLWDFKSLLTGGGGSNPFFNGTYARLKFAALPGTPFVGTPVPVENSGGSGTRDAHWRETVFDNELMTGYLNPSPNPLSPVTIGAMRDYGYQVSYLFSDAYALPGPLAAPRGGLFPKRAIDVIRPLPPNPYAPVVPPRGGTRPPRR